MSELVLIADGDAERGKAIAEACASRGMATSIATHGAAALEAALSHNPMALVCQLGLPLIDGGRLAEILHANPRTQSLTVLFLGDRAGDEKRSDVRGRIVAAPVDADEVASAVEALVLEKHPGGAAPAETASGGVEGELAQLSLPDLLELFHVSRKTGTVELVRRDARNRRETGRVMLKGGDVIQAGVGPVEGVKAFYRLLSWDRGSFSFKPTPISSAPAIQTPTRALLREGLRQLQEWERLAVELPPLDGEVALTIPRSSLPNVIHPLTQEVLLVLEMHARVRDVVDHCAFPDYQVLRTLHTLIGRGIVELRREPSLGEGASQPGLFLPAQAARLREWLEGPRPGSHPSRDAKLLVVSSDIEATRNFAQLLDRLQDVELDTRVATGAFTGDDLIRLGRLNVDGDIGVELVQVPATPAFAPLWPYAGHGALGTLFLLSGPVSEAVQSVQPIARELLRLPRARLFHLLLLEGGQRVEPEALRQNLSLLDEGSLFLIPLDNLEKAGVLLRETFGHVLP